jgi:endonuclease/exonuclease/phosphatase family metal-dependent hydrolase
MRLISWNVNGRRNGPRRANLDEQLSGIAGVGPDVVALQEVTRTTESEWLDGLAAAGLPHAASSVGLLPPDRTYANLLAARWPLVHMPPSEFDIPWPEKVLSVVVSAPEQAVEIHVAHLPTGVDHPLAKMATFEGIHERLARSSRRPRILCGDFNTPREERDGDVVTWAGSHPRWRERWDRAERSVITGLTDFNLGDVYRRLHGPHRQEGSWQPRSGPPRRYDHVFASASMEPRSCEYLHAWRKEQRLSDHSPILVEFGKGMEAVAEAPGAVERVDPALPEGMPARDRAGGA